MFTLHGHERKPIDEYARSGSDLKLGRVLLDRSRIAQMWKELQVLGVNRFSVFPDLDNAAAHVCWMLQSEE